MENGFGLIASVFRIFLKPIEIKVQSTVVDIVLTCVFVRNQIRLDIIHPKDVLIMRMRALAKLLEDLGEK